MLLQFFHCL